MLRILYGGAALCCAALVAFALYLQYAKGIDPCPLCLIQRVVVIAIGAVCMLAACHNPDIIGRRVYGLLTVILGLFGVAVAGRHLWLQNLPAEEVPACGPGLVYILENFPLGDALDLVLSGSGECAEVAWRFLGLTIPGWTLVVFLGLFLFGLQQMLISAKVSASRRS